MTREFLRPAQAARIWPHNGKPPHPSKIVRAIVRGTASRQRPGTRIVLRAIRDSQGWLTTQEWVEEFLAALTLDRGGSMEMPSSAERGQAAIARLKAGGW